MTKVQPGRLPESAAHVEAFDERLRRDPARVIEGLQRFREFCRANAIDSLEGVGLPLRPFFLKSAPLKRIARDCFRLVERLRDHIARALPDLDELSERTAVPRSFLAAIDVASTLASPRLLDIMRPDGFYDERGFHLSELNVGNGTLISATYCEALHHYYSTCSAAMADMQLAPTTMGRPFVGLRDLFCAGTASPHVALLMSTMDLMTKEHWGLRAPQQLSWAPQILSRMGVSHASVHEGDILAAPGERAHDVQGKPFDVIFNVTTGLGFFDAPERLAIGGDLERYRGANVGTTPMIAPLGALAFEKGVLTQASAFMSDLCLQLPRTVYPTDADAVSYRLERERYVIKRAYGDKHTFVGCSTDGRRWNAMVEHALSTREYIVQDYVPLSRTTVPVFIDDRITWLEVRVEVSPFITHGVHVGTMVRYAPDDEGLILSPPPEQMGFGLVCEV